MKRERRICVDDRELEPLLHPSQVYEHPADVVIDPDLSLNEKRAVVASWASDACAIEAAPALRTGRDGRRVRFDDIMEALRMLDRQSCTVPASGHDYPAFPRRSKDGRGGADHGVQATPLY